ncbi:MAG: OsmC family protein [Saprospiraceae bacterium]|nr:OsmC family protein [Saprospiraceae bacterium]
MTSEVIYQGELRTVATHLASNSSFITDAPTDNHGKGAAFSPTDLVATALATCMITVMGIKADQKGINIDGARAMIKKIMADSPRRIAEVQVTIYMPQYGYSAEEKSLLEHTARTCPVARSLSEGLTQTIQFVW